MCVLDCWIAALPPVLHVTEFTSENARYVMSRHTIAASFVFQVTAWRHARCVTSMRTITASVTPTAPRWNTRPPTTTMTMANQPIWRKRTENDASDVAMPVSRLWKYMIALSSSNRHWMSTAVLNTSCTGRYATPPQNSQQKPHARECEMTIW